MDKSTTICKFIIQCCKENNYTMDKKQFSELAKQLSKDKRKWLATLDNLKSNPLVKKYEMFQSIYWDIPAEVTKPLSDWFHNHNIIKQYIEHKSNNPISLKNIRALVDSYISVVTNEKSIEQMKKNLDAIMIKGKKPYKYVIIPEN